MRILSLNGWGGRLGEELVSYIKGADPDVFCLQEVTNTPDAASPWLIYRDGGAELPQRANLFAEVAGVLPGHQAFFCPAARGPLHHGDSAFQSEWGLATFVRRSLPVIGQVQDFIHGAFSADGFGEHPRSRNAHAVRLHDYATRRTTLIVHLHGLRELDGKGDTPARNTQTTRLIELIDRVRHQHDGLVVCGDFNVLPESRMLAALRDIGLTELVMTRGFIDTRTSYYSKTPRFADYMLVSDNVGVRRFEVVAAPQVSDHRALLLEIG
ncbi:endonuclease/exonuclease/phosphatase family metal-dependent hydrolase [Aminobacter lissarensis]|uniref:Endonuclease/exonuclease/phosphatase family metal-dependent hydrolase n=1 Tax=Aminobacter carboxidus TaxID=376165 RepID=A0A8E2BC71_9HYPH|nr:endonuclease/exonuclease/phosphatase family protein [Aminobacter lissarensis]MBB6465894.1 endonuclease/exonuclease/phosphatase family metal-dependent hydrolase [Aminobacter lissarensis]